MADLTEAEVRALARVRQLPLTAEDTAEMTHRLNAFLEALAPLADTEGVDAAPAPVDPDRA